MLKPFTVLPFRGYASGSTVIVAGRVIENNHPLSPKKDDPWWRNLSNMTRIFLRARAEKAALSLFVKEEMYRLETDAIGYFETTLSLAKPLLNPGWINIDFQLQPINGYTHIAQQKGEILNLPVTSRFSHGIISDIDDTILETYATDLLMSARMTFFNNSTTRIAIEGMASLYRRIAGETEDTSPVFYITSSSWSLYSLMTNFLELQDFPKGPLLMQKIGMTNNKLISRGHGHKTHKIETILRTTGNVKFFLFGDNGQEDRQIYHDIASRYPDRIAAVCIRVAREKARKVDLDYTSFGIPYFEFTDGFSLQRQVDKAGLLPGF